MEIEEGKQLKEKAEVDILAIIEKLKTDTKCFVIGINYSQDNIYIAGDSQSRELNFVEIEIKL